jgi:hypothetical protein
MKKSFDDLPGWIFDMEEISANVYEVTAIDTLGHRVQIKGVDPETLLDNARRGAKEIQQKMSAQ